MKKLILLITITLCSSFGNAVPCTNQDLKMELIKKYTALQVGPDLSPCELSKKAVEYNFFAIALITASCPSNPDVNEVLAKYQRVKDHAEDLVKEYCGL